MELIDGYIKDWIQQCMRRKENEIHPVPLMQQCIVLFNVILNKINICMENIVCIISFNLVLKLYQKKCLVLHLSRMEKNSVNMIISTWCEQSMRNCFSASICKDCCVSGNLLWDLT